MQNTYKTIAIIVAAGSGNRVSRDFPKQYMEINGETILSRSIRKFTEHPLVDAVVVVISEGHTEYYNKSILGHSVLSHIVGGERRQDSVRNALNGIEIYKPERVVIHDSVRTFVGEDDISNVLRKLEVSDAAIVATKLNDTVKEVNDGFIKRTVPRDDLFLAQTPQAFRYGFIKELHNKYKSMNFTDDSSICEQDGCKVEVVESSAINFKITTVEDLELAKKLI